MSSPILYKSIFVTTRKKLLHNKQKVNTSQTLFKDSILAPEKTLIYSLATLLWSEELCSGHTPCLWLETLAVCL